jgi:hypothetical protein
MKLPGTKSPMLLVGLSGIGCLIYLAGFLIASSHLLSRGWRGFLFLLLMGLGMAVTWLAGERMKGGIRDETWAHEKIVRLRALVEHPAFTAIQWLAIVIFAASAFALHHPHFRALGWPLFWLNLAMGQLKVSVRPKVDKSVGGTLHDAAPIQSEHWGGTGGARA